MNNETIVVMGFFTLRMILLGGILFALPRIARKGLVFGTYVGEDVALGDAARGVRRGWDLGWVVLVAVALVVGYGICIAGRPVTGNLSGTAFLLVTAPFLYVRAYRAARGLAPPAAARQAELAAAPLVVDAARGRGFALLALVLCLLSGIGTMVYATVLYGDMPERIPTLSNQFGVSERIADKALVAVLFLPSVSLVLSTAFAFMGLLITHAKRSLRAGTGGHSPEAQDAFRRLYSILLSGMGLCTCLFLSVTSVQMVRVVLGRIESLGWEIGVVAGITILFALGGLVRVLRVHGQGGALREDGSADAPLTGGLADNAHWIGGLIYVDREDPSMLVECRFGYGYTLNLGNRSAVLFLVIYLALLLALTVLALTGAVS